MSTKFIFKFFKIAITVLFYFLIIISVFVLFISVMNILGMNERSASKFDNNALNYDVLAVDIKKSEPAVYAKDSLIRYRPINNKYTLNVEPASTMGYYLLFMKMVLLSIGIAILWNFKKIFTEITLAQPFKNTITRKLKIIAALFIIADVLRIIDYLIFNSFLQRHIPSPHFELLTSVGSEMINGLIIWIIAVIYERGTNLQEEVALTV